jgi:hypothetical protein
MKRFYFIVLFTFLIIGCTKLPKLPYGYLFDYDDGGDISLLRSKNIVVIYGHITDFNFNSTYLIASECPRDSVKECRYENNENYRQCNRAFKKSKFRQYWIVNMSNDSVWGPFRRNIYLKKKHELGVPDSLKLEFELFKE